MLLPVTKASDISEEKQAARWLVEDLWLDEGVGFIGGEPKTCKTSMSLEMAVAISSGHPCLRRYAVKKPGLVLMYAAEDSHHVIKRRLAAVCAASGVALDECDIQLITVPVLRLDIKEHRDDLADTVAELKPTLLILDPFIRMHGIDENHSGEVAPLLGYLRALQKLHGTAIAVVHHARKRSGNSRAGQSLRGSSEFHAWYDSHLYLSRDGADGLRLDVEHRSEQSRDGIALRIAQQIDGVTLEAVEDTGPETEADGDGTPGERVLKALATQSGAKTLNALREACRMRKSSVAAALDGLVRDGAVRRVEGGYELSN
jgi:hypothetical protein